MIVEPKDPTWLKSTFGTLVNLRHVSNIRRVGESLTSAGEEKQFYITAFSNVYVDENGTERAEENILFKGNLIAADGYMKRLEALLSPKYISAE